MTPAQQNASCAILWKLPTKDRDRINRFAQARGMTQPDYLAWAVRTAEAADPLAAAPREPVSKAVRDEFERAFRPALTKNTEHLAVEVRLAALREFARELVGWAAGAQRCLRGIAAEKGR